MRMVLPAFTQEDIQKSIDIRHEVFVIGQNVPIDIEVDEFDKEGSGCIHFLIFDDEQTVGTFRVIVDDNMEAKLQRFCVLEKYRGQGFGTLAIEFLEGFAAGQGIKRINFDAQCTARSFYERLGYSVISDEFIEAGMLHVKMTKKID